MFIIALVESLFVTNVSAAQTVSNEDSERGLLGRGEIIHNADIPENSVLIGEGFVTIPVYADNEEGIDVLSSNAIYELTVYHAEYYNEIQGLSYRLDVTCSDSNCQISSISGEATVYEYSDWEYGVFPIYASNLVLTNTITASDVTGLIFTPGKTDLYVGYSFKVSLANGQIAGKDKFDLRSDKLTIPK